MKKVLIFACLLLLFSCSSIENTSNLTNTEINGIYSKIREVQNEIIMDAKNNDKQKIKERVVSSLINDIKFSYLDKYDLSKALVVFSDEIEIQNINSAKSVLLINFELETMYFDVIWNYVENKWKIKSIDPQ
ncbi:hypothetical protein [Pseudostreptobacillus hongkongensis]|uniref:hypothetical protein n=1 Tax=Pseudostreptobacillus hongkongensis TaxID=1162717 RepID=UPI000831DE4F|nr:hypothetical protein [Pseudostreptobacillus hongkongensis]